MISGVVDGRLQEWCEPVVVGAQAGGVQDARLNEGWADADEPDAAVAVVEVVSEAPGNKQVKVGLGGHR